MYNTHFCLQCIPKSPGKTWQKKFVRLNTQLEFNNISRANDLIKNNHF